MGTDVETTYLEACPANFRDKCDMVLVLDSKARLPVHSHYLSGVSDVLCDIIEEALEASPSKKKGSAAHKPAVPLPDTSLYEANTFLCYVYNRDFSLGSRSAGLALARLCHKFNVGRGIEVADEYLAALLIGEEGFKFPESVATTAAEEAAEGDAAADKGKKAQESNEQEAEGEEEDDEDEEDEEEEEEEQKKEEGPPDVLRWALEAQTYDLKAVTAQCELEMMRQGPAFFGQPLFQKLRPAAHARILRGMASALERPFCAIRCQSCKAVASGEKNSKGAVTLRKAGNGNGFFQAVCRCSDVSKGTAGNVYPTAQELLSWQ